MFFKDSVSRAVYRSRLYRGRGQASTTNGEDNIYERGSLLRLSKRRKKLAYIGRKTLVVSD